MTAAPCLSWGLPSKSSRPLPPEQGHISPEAGVPALRCAPAGPAITLRSCPVLRRWPWHPAALAMGRARKPGKRQIGTHPSGLPPAGKYPGSPCCTAGQFGQSPGCRGALAPVLRRAPVRNVKIVCYQGFTSSNIRVYSSPITPV